MRICLLLLLLLTQLPARASQIAVGIWSKNFLAWDVWEQETPKLTHRLLLYNQAAHEVELEIRLLRFKEVHYQFVTVPTHKVLFRVKLRAGQLVQLNYPKQHSKLDFMEFLENGQRVGVQEINGTQPPAKVLQKDFRFYSATSANAGQLGYWLALESLYRQPHPVRLVLFRPKGYNEQYQLLKITAGMDTLSRRPSNLDSLRSTDAAIIRLDSQRQQAVMLRPALAATAALAMLTLEIQYMRNTYYYNEQKVKQLHSSSSGGARHFIPVFTKPGE